MGADVLPDRYERPKGFQVMLATPDAQEAERAFAALSENAEIGMPLQETFWALRFGVLVDQFGIPWSVNCEQAP
jgi:PhnB protein